MKKKLIACRFVLMVSAVTFPWLSIAMAQQTPSVAAKSNDIASLARSLDLGERMILTNIGLGSEEATYNLVLQRFAVFKPNAEILVHYPDGPKAIDAPNTVYLSGYVEGSPRSYAYLSVREDGSMRGVVNDIGRHFMLAAGEQTGVLSAGLYSRQIGDEELQEDFAEFSCSSDNLPGITQSNKVGPANKPELKPQPTVFPTRGKLSSIYQVEVALETDNQFYDLFGNATDATEYLGDLIAFSSGIYEAELSTALTISHISLWPPETSDPYTDTSTVCLMFAMGKYWNDNRGDVSRTVTHFVSGVNNGGGVAWVGVLCDGGFNTSINAGCSFGTTNSNYGGAYGYSGDIDGNFDINNPSVVWDLVVVSHELGHNFNSPHTHCYAGLNGNANDIDPCYNAQNNCYAGVQALPSGCPGTGQGCGTIMSYCHLSFAGGLSNIALTLGLNHPYGIEPDRVPTRMGNHVSSVNGFNPTCLVELYPAILGDWPDNTTILEILDIIF